MCILKINRFKELIKQTVSLSPLVLVQCRSQLTEKTNHYIKNSETKIKMCLL